MSGYIHRSLIPVHETPCANSHTSTHIMSVGQLHVHSCGERDTKLVCETCAAPAIAHVLLGSTHQAQLVSTPVSRSESRKEV